MNQVALITGGSRGIGRGIALELARIGFSLVLNYNSNRAAAEEAAQLCLQAAETNGHSPRVEVCPGNVSSAADRQRLIDFTREQFARLDLLVNNAGMAPRIRADLLEATEQSFDELMAVNVRGPFFLTQLAAKWMIELSQAQSIQPQIVTISSVSAYTASVNRGEYCVSKAALSMITPLFAARLAEYGIRVYEIRPGIISTDMTAGVTAKYDELIASGLTPIKRWGTPADIGKAVAAIAQDSFPFSTGEVINVDGGFHFRRL